MNRWTRIYLGLLAMALSATFASAQGVQTGTLQGTAVDSEGLVLPGVTVTVTSPALQGNRSTVTDDNGTFALRGLPAGAYEVVFELTGFNSKTETTTVALGSTAQVTGTLSIGGVTETINVTANPIDSVITSTQGTANFTYKEVQALPIGRTPFAIATLSPGLNTNTPNVGQLQINGAFAYDNVFLIDGVDVNDNLFGTANGLFVEDAIEETQILTSGISAEYGRFTGGVVNVITKSGGDQFSGSFRANLTNDSWQRRSPFEKVNNVTRPDKTNETYEGTFGGPILRSRLWFFGSGRYAETANQTTLPVSGFVFDSASTNKRGEGKLTATPIDNHMFQGSYMSNATDQTRVPFGFSIDPKVVESPSFPNDRVQASYRGVLTNKLLVEARGSRKTFGFRDAGGTSTNLSDSPFIGLSQQVHYNAPYFDATDPEDRNNYQFTGNASYYLGTQNAGSHDIKVGFELFNSSRTGGNSQSPTSQVYYADFLENADGTPVLDGGGNFIPVFVTGESLLETYHATRGAQVDTRTLSFFAQDSWRATSKLTFDVGARYERVRGEATGGLVTVDTDTFAPRLAATFSPKLDGSLVFQTTYAWYAGKYSESQFAANTTVGNPNFIHSLYEGPAGQGREFAPGLDPSNYDAFTGEFPTANVFFEDGLSSPILKEFTVSAGSTFLQNKAFAKITLVDRHTTNFVEDFITLEGGETHVVRDGVDFGTFPNQIFRNSDVPVRNYRALIAQGRYNVTSRLGLYANWTYQLKAEGNFEGESVSSPGDPSLLGDYPEIFDENRNFPIGRVDDFQRHRVRAWAVYNQDLGFLGDIGMSLIYNYNSPRVYSLSATNVPLTPIQQSLGAAYASIPAAQTLFFGERGSEFFNDVSVWDAGLEYGIPVFRQLRPYVKLDVFNVLNQRKLVNWNTVVRADASSSRDGLGLPTGYIEGAQFGRATSSANFLQARRFQVALGFRF